jgi:hypothetical protein
MTKKAFYRKLGKVKNTDRHEWQVFHSIRDIIRYSSCNKAARTNFDFDFCPVTIVCYKETNHVFAPSQFKSAAQFIGLNKEDAECIVAAADDREWHRTDPFSKQALRCSRKALLRRLCLQ